MIGETLRRVRFAPILTATVLTILLLLLVKTVANVLVLLFLGILLSLGLGALAGVLHRRARLPERWAFVAAVALANERLEREGRTVPVPPPPEADEAA